MGFTTLLPVNPFVVLRFSEVFMVLRIKFTGQIPVTEKEREAFIRESGILLKDAVKDTTLQTALEACYVSNNLGIFKPLGIQTLKEAVKGIFSQTVSEAYNAYFNDLGVFNSQGIPIDQEEADEASDFEYQKFNLLASSLIMRERLFRDEEALKERFIEIHLEALRRFDAEQKAQLREPKASINHTEEPIPTETNPTCGTLKIHKIIDRAFYSIDKPANKISPEEVMVIIKAEFDEWDKKRITRKIDQQGVILKIEDNNIYWSSYHKDTDRPFLYRSFCDSVRKLKAMLAESDTK